MASAPSTGSSPPSAVPIVDVAAFRHSPHPDSDPAAIAAARAMGEAFERCGFVVITGHGLPVELGDELYAKSAAFHDLPLDTKIKCQNFIPHGDENVSQLIGNMSKPNDISDRLSIANEHIGTAAEKHYGGSPGNTMAPSRHPNAVRILGGNPREAARQAERATQLHADELVPGIQDAGQKYFDGVHRVWQLLTRMCEVELKLPLHYFDSFYPDKWSAGSLRCYPTLASEADLEPEQLRFGAHTDSGEWLPSSSSTLHSRWTDVFSMAAPGGLTLLRTDMEGLQCNLDGEWHDVPVVRGALVVNVARLLARWTNDRWTSAIHRVKNDHVTTHRKLTLGMFTSPIPDVIIEALPTYAVQDTACVLFALEWAQP